MTTRCGSCPCVFVLALLTGGCGEAPEIPSAESIASLDQVIDWVDSVTLEENDTALPVAPFLSDVDGGEYLVADTREDQGRVYRADGQLVVTFGRRGNGPGELKMPRAVFRRGNEEYLVVDRRGRLEYYSGAGASTRSVTLPLTGIDAPQRLGEDLLLLAGRGQAAPELRLHIWDLTGDSLVRSFFAPEERLDRAMMPLSAPMSTAVWGDTIAATVNTVDTLYYFSFDGEPIGQVPIPFRAFRLITMPDQARASPEWVSSWEQIVLLARSESGTILVPSATFTPPDWRLHLLGMTPEGQLRFDLQDALRLQGVDGDLLVFNAPGAELPSEWVRARLKHGW